MKFLAAVEQLCVRIHLIKLCSTDENKDGAGIKQIMNQNGGNIRGMSSKKIHEVQCMSDFIIGQNNIGHHDLIIDVGSGAGHLERTILKTGFGMYFNFSRQIKYWMIF